MDELIWQVEREWAGETCAIIGGGPSLIPADVEAVRSVGVRAIAVNNAYSDAPWADILLFNDLRWWFWHHDKPGFVAFRGRKATLHQFELKSKYPDDYLLLGNAHARRGLQRGLSLTPGWLVPGGNVGYTAMNLAVQLGAAKILLLGVDMGWHNGRTHCHGGHPVKAKEDCYPVMIQAFHSAVDQLRELDVEVINCSMISRLGCFPKLSVSEALTKVRS